MSWSWIFAHPVAPSDRKTEGGQAGSRGFRGGSGSQCALAKPPNGPYPEPLQLTGTSEPTNHTSDTPASKPLCHTLRFVLFLSTIVNAPNADLLNQLRIDRSEPKRSMLPWVLGVVLLAAGAGGYAWWDRAQTIEVAAATAVAVPVVEGVSTTVLEASGYVTARRQATVSAKFTGKVREVLIEEGQQVEDSVIRAPFAGVVIAKAAQPGEMISPISAGGGFTRTGIGTIVDMDSLEVQVDVNEAYINRVRAGQPVEAVLNAYSDWKIPAEVIAIIPAADRTKATVKVRIALRERDTRIVPDMGVRVAFLEANASAANAPGPEAAPGVLVPTGAIVDESGARSVFVIEGETVALRAVKLGQTYGSSRQILSGLELGERVVRDPPATLQSGARVRVSPATKP